MRARGIVFAGALLLLVAYNAAAAPDGDGSFKSKCAPCHGTTGRGDTPTGRQKQIRDLGSPEIQKLSDDELAKAAIECGKNVRPDEASSLVGVIRAFGRRAGEASRERSQFLLHLAADRAGRAFLRAILEWSIAGDGEEPGLARPRSECGLVCFVLP